MLSTKQIISIVAASIGIPIAILLTFKICRVLDEATTLLHNGNTTVKSASDSMKRISGTVETTADNFNKHSDEIFTSFADFMKQLSDYTKKYGLEGAIARIAKAMGKK